jgi:hypothetical protein
MTLPLDSIRRLGRAAGDSVATGALQRLEQTVANFQVRHDATQDEVSQFRAAAADALRDALLTRYHIELTEVLDNT